jgi:diacylglycerol kinase (ATP)
MHFHFVVNPAAGRGRALPLAEAVATALDGLGAKTSKHVTTGPGDGAAHLAAMSPDACDRLVVVGGDGTLREVVNAREAPLPWPVGILPMGTANLVGRELGMLIGRKAGRIAKGLIESTPWTVDVLRLTRADGSTELAVANAGIGLDAEIVRAVAEVRSGGPGGYMKWIRPIIRSVSDFRFPRLHVTIDDHVTYAAGACIVQNAYNYGGIFELAKGAALDSGQLDVALIRTRSHRDLFRILFGALTRRAAKAKDVKFIPAQRVSLKASPRTRVQADGDPAGWTDLSIERVPDGLTLLRAP